MDKLPDANLPWRFTNEFSSNKLVKRSADSASGKLDKSNLCEGIE